MAATVSAPPSRAFTLRFSSATSSWLASACAGGSASGSVRRSSMLGPSVDSLCPMMPGLGRGGPPHLEWHLRWRVVIQLTPTTILRGGLTCIGPRCWSCEGQRWRRYCFARLRTVGLVSPAKTSEGRQAYEPTQALRLPQIMTLCGLEYHSKNQGSLVELPRKSRQQRRN